jgi:hypothetical protein
MLIRNKRIIAVLISLAAAMPLAGQETTQPHKKPASPEKRKEADFEIGLKPYQDKYDKLKARANAIAHDISAITGRADVSPEALHHAAAEMDDQYFNLQLDQAGSKARLDAILRESEELSQATTKASNEDPVGVELRKVVEVREMELQKAKGAQQAGAANDSDVQDAIARLAEAKARLASEKAQAALAAGGDTIIALRKQMVDLTIAQQDHDARLAFVTKEREKLTQGMQLLDEMQSLLNQAEDVQSLLRTFKQALPPPDADQ